MTDGAPKVPESDTSRPTSPSRACSEDARIFFGGAPLDPLSSVTTPLLELHAAPPRAGCGLSPRTDSLNVQSWIYSILGFSDARRRRTPPTPVFLPRRRRSKKCTAWFGVNGLFENYKNLARIKKLRAKLAPRTNVRNISSKFSDFKCLRSTAYAFSETSSVDCQIHLLLHYVVP